MALENLAQTQKKRPKFPVWQFDFPCNHRVLVSLAPPFPPLHFLAFEMSVDVVVVVIVVGGMKIKSLDDRVTDNGVL